MQIVAHKASKQGKQDANRQSSATVKGNKKRKSAPVEKEEGSQPKAKTRSSKVIDKAKQICKAATVKISPSMFLKTKSLEDIEHDMLALLAKHSLSLESSPHDISRARDRYVMCSWLALLDLYLLQITLSMLSSEIRLCNHHCQLHLNHKTHVPSRRMHISMHPMGTLHLLQSLLYFNVSM